MSDILQDILIIKIDGKTLASKIRNLSEVEEFVGMFISALCSFAESIHESELNNFEFSNLRFDLLRRDSVIFVGTSNKAVKKKKVLKELEKIAEKFLDLFPVSVIDNLNGDLSMFSEFEESLEMSRKEQLIEFISDHWPSNSP